MYITETRVYKYICIHTIYVYTYCNSILSYLDIIE